MERITSVWSDITVYLHQKLNKKNFPFPKQFSADQGYTPCCHIQLVLNIFEPQCLHVGTLCRLARWDNVPSIFQIINVSMRNIWDLNGLCCNPRVAAFANACVGI